MGIKVSDAAAQRAKTFLDNRGKGLGLAIGRKDNWLLWFGYVLEFVDEFNADDQVFEDNGIKIIIDGKSLVYLGRHRVGLC